MQQQPVTLYVGVEEGSKPDLGAVARAAIAFEAAAREILFVLDPSIQVRIELDSGTEGSLKLNSTLKAVVSKVTDRKVLGAAAFTLLCWFSGDVRSYLTEKALDKIIGEEEPDLSAIEVKALAEEVVRLLRGDVGKEQAQTVYRELERDPKVISVGVTTVPDGSPRSPVPRASFPDFLREDPQADMLPHTRDREEEVTVNLVSPVLLPGTRRWKFSFHEGEFGAPILDEAFLRAVLSGLYPIQMVAGITMRVILRTREEMVDGVWTIHDRSIVKVLGHQRAPRQTSFDLSPSESQDDKYDE